MSLPKDIVNIIIDYTKCYTRVPRDENKISWWNFFANLTGISGLETNDDIVDWNDLSVTQNTIPLSKKDMDEINAFRLSIDPDAMPLFEKHQYDTDELINMNPSLFELTIDPKLVKLIREI